MKLSYLVRSRIKATSMIWSEGPKGVLYMFPNLLEAMFSTHAAARLPDHVVQLIDLNFREV